MSKLETVHVTNGKFSKVVNKAAFEAGEHKGFDLVAEKADKPEKSEAEKIANLSVSKLAEAINGFDDEQLDEVLAAEKAGKDRSSAIEAIEAEKAAE